MPSSLICEKPRTYRYWWSIVPVLPSSRESHWYRALWRQWADHTMNPVKLDQGEWHPKSSRGFFTESREDHIATVLFHTWALFPDVSWVQPFLNLWGTEHEPPVRQVRWSYSFEQKRSPSDRPDIADIVLCFEDAGNEAILVIETKKRGGKLGKKVHPDSANYLDLPSIRPFLRRHYVLLVDDHFLKVFEKYLRSTASEIKAGQ